MQIYDIVGTIGVILIVTAYLLLQLGSIRSDQIGFSVMNSIGAALIIISLVFDFNLSAFLIEAFWLVISFVGILRAMKKRHQTLD